MNLNISASPGESYVKSQLVFTGYGIVLGWALFKVSRRLFTREETPQTSKDITVQID